jgi:uncharacterized protein
MEGSDLTAVRDRLRGSVPRDVQLVVLFGSVARERAGPQSDTDVAVLCDRMADLDALFIAFAPVFRTERLDLVDLRRSGSVLSFRVARDGILLYERTPARFHEFQSLASRRYADTEKLRRAQQRAIAVFLDRSA